LLLLFVFTANVFGQAPKRFTITPGRTQLIQAADAVNNALVSIPYTTSLRVKVNGADLPQAFVSSHVSQVNKLVFMIKSSGEVEGLSTLTFPVTISTTDNGINTAAGPPAGTVQDPSNAQAANAPKITHKPLLDALTIHACFNSGNYSAAKQVLEAYTGSIDNNPFLKDYKDIFNRQPLRIAGTGLASAQNGDNTSGGAIFSSTSVIDAIARTIVKHFKEELDIAYLQRFRDSLARIKEFQLLFPATYKVIENMDPYDYNLFLATLQESAQSDIATMPDNMKNTVQYDLNNRRIKDRDAGYYFLIALDIMNAIRQSEHPAVAFSDISHDGFADSISDKNVKAVLNTVIILSHSIENTDGTGWVSYDKLFKLSGGTPPSDTLRHLFLGLMYEKEKFNLQNISVGNTNLKALIDQHAAAYLKLADVTLGDAAKAQRMIGDINAKISAGTIGFDDYTEYINNTMNMVKDVVNNWPGDADLNKLKTKYIPAGEDGLSLVKNAHNKKYGIAFIDAVHICTDVVGDSFIRHSETIRIYGAFLMNLARAQSSSDLANALDNAAMPVGSYKVKRSSAMNICIQSYAGITAGYEWLMPGGKGAFNIGPTAPVGIAFSWGNREVYKLSGSSFTLFFPVIDVGAVALFRLDNDTSPLPKTITWRQVLSPGVIFAVGLKNTPITIFAGAQYSPQLRQVDNIADNSIRVNAGVVVDIPLFNLYTRKGKAVDPHK
jgi:hypothetical protein